MKKLKMEYDYKVLILVLMEDTHWDAYSVDDEYFHTMS